jgi:tetratricopeptide (TPR) repeat protein
VAVLWRRAEHNFGVAQTNHRRAEANFGWAQEAVEEMLTQVGEGLADVPQMEPLRRSLLEKARRLHENFLRDKADDPAVRLDAARAYGRLGDIRQLLGQRAEAAQAYHAARGLYEQVSADAPTQPEPAVELARMLQELGILGSQAGNYQEAEPLYRQALDLLDRVSDDSAAGYRAANGGHLLGNLLQQTSRLADAEEAYRQSLRGLDRLDPKVPRHRQQRASTLNSLASLCRRTNRPEAAQDAYLEARGVLQQLVDDFPRRDYRAQLAGVYGNLGLLWANAFPNRRLDALDALRRAVVIAEQLVREFSSVPKYRQNLAFCHLQLGLLLEQLDSGPKIVRYRGLLGGFLAAAPAGPLHVVPVLGLKPDELSDQALAAYRSARTLQEQLVAESGGLATYRYELALTCDSLGHLFNALDRYPEAGEVLDQSRALSERLVEEYPRNAAYRNGLAGAVGNQAARLRRSGRVAESLPLSREAIRHRRATLDLSPGDGNYQGFLRGEYALLAETLVRFGDHSQAARVADEWVGAFPRHGLSYRQAARFLARCVPLARKDSNLTSTQGEGLAQTYTARAVKLLHNGIALDRPDPAALGSALQKDPAFEPLRADPDFRTLLAELRDKSKTPAP